MPWVVPPGDTALAAPGRGGWGAYTLIQTLLSQLTAAATAVLDWGWGQGTTQPSTAHLKHFSAHKPTCGLVT